MGSYILSCTDCHEAHGSTNNFLIRTVVNSETVAVTKNGAGGGGKEWASLCERCHRHDSAVASHDHKTKDSSKCDGCHPTPPAYKTCTDTGCHPHVATSEDATPAANVTIPTASKSVNYGALYSISGVLTVGQTPLAGQRVQLEESSSGKTFSAMSVFATTTVDGKFTFRVKPSTKRWYRVRFDETDEYSGFVSSATLVRVRSYVGTPKAPSKMRRTRRYTVYSYLKPRHKGGTYPVRIYMWKKTSSGKWKRYGYVKAKVMNYRSYSKYCRTIQLPTKGTWRLRAYAPSDSGHLAKWSGKYDYVAVR
jgi:hypothetical protein